MARSTVAVAILMFAGLLAGACGGGTAASRDNGDASSATTVEGVTDPTAALEIVATSDGDATLLVPPGALPADVKLEDIKILSVTDDRAVVSEHGGLLGAYELQPDGLQLLAPVTLTVQLPPGGVPGQIFAVHISGDETETVTSVTIERAPEGDTLVASMQITHFSNVYVVYVPLPFQAEVTASASEVAFGETFEVLGVVRRTVGPERLIETLKVPPSKIYYYVDNTPWQLDGSIDVIGSAAPERIESIPSSTSVSGSMFTLPPVTVECTSSGSAHARYQATVEYPLKKLIVVPDYGGLWSDPSTTSVTIRDVTESVSCVMPQVVASGAPPLTTYTISPAVPSATFYVWSGATCGEVTGSTTRTMVWDHGQEGCDHGGEAHPEANISLLMAGTFPISGEQYELRCTYTSAASGVGLHCAPEAQ